MQRPSNSISFVSPNRDSRIRVVIDVQRRYTASSTTATPELAPRRSASPGCRLPRLTNTASGRSDRLGARRIALYLNLDPPVEHYRSEGREQSREPCQAPLRQS